MPDQNLFSIAVVGSMNPVIHHPVWYKNAGIIDANAEKVALQDQNIITSSAISRFTTADFDILCTSDKWRVQSEDTNEGRKRAIELTAKVFDDKLHETPLRAFGINFDHHRKSSKVDVASILGDMVSKMNVVRRDRHVPISASLNLKFSLDSAAELNLRVEPSAIATDTVFIALNFHHNVPPSDGVSAHFAVEGLLRTALAEAEHERETILNDVLARFEEYKLEQ